MKFLLDTNTVIPAEPTRLTDVEPTTVVVTKLIGLLAEGHHQYYIHPSSSRELAGDRDHDRRTLRQTLLAKYPELPAAPFNAIRVDKVIGTARPGTNDAVDNLLLESILAEAIDYLVTSDVGIHKKATRLGIVSRVVRPEDAIAIIRGLFRTSPDPPPAVELVHCHQLDDNDAIFDSFRSLYGALDFNAWLSRCKRDHRKAWVVRHPQSTALAAICIVKDESAREHGLQGSLLKICSFQVAPWARGFRFGELLLKAVFQHVAHNAYDWSYVEVFPEVTDLIALFESFGFDRINPVTSRGEIVLAKPFKFTQDQYDSNVPLEFNRRFGPLAVKTADTDIFLVPIIPKYHDLLFPEEATQTQLFSGRHPFGNSILKAYLCNAQARNISEGSVLAFYRSGGRREFRCSGVVEQVMVSRDATQVARLVGQRTVYSFSEIEAMCSREVLALLFRQARTMEPPVNLDDLIAAGGVAGIPQSIARVRKEGRQWLASKISP